MYTQLLATAQRRFAEVASSQYPLTVLTDNARQASFLAAKYRAIARFGSHPVSVRRDGRGVTIAPLEASNAIR